MPCSHVFPGVGPKPEAYKCAGTADSPSTFQITARKLIEDVSYTAAKSLGNTILWLMHRVVEDTRTDDQLRAGQEELRLKQVGD